MKKLVIVRKLKQNIFTAQRLLTYLYILTLAVAVVGNREFVIAFLASSLFESTQAFVTLAVRSADRSITTWCFTFWTAHAPWSSSTYHALFSFFAPHFRTTLCRIETIRICAHLRTTNVSDNAIVTTLKCVEIIESIKNCFLFFFVTEIMHARAHAYARVHAYTHILNKTTNENKADFNYYQEKQYSLFMYLDKDDTAHLHQELSRKRDFHYLDPRQNRQSLLLRQTRNNFLS